MSSDLSTVRPRLLLVGGKDSGFSSASDMAVAITLLQQFEDLTPLQLERAEEVILCDLSSPGLTVALAHTLHSEHQFSAVLSFDERWLELAGRLGEELGVLHNPLPAVECTRSKVAMRHRMEVSGLPSVGYAECGSAGAVQAFLEKTGAPIMLKPGKGSGSRGVTMVQDATEVEDAWQRCISAELGTALAEEFVAGPEFSVETLTLDGAHSVLAITEKLTTGAPSFVETGHQLPARLSSDDAASLKSVTLRLLDAIGHRWGPAHTEVMLTHRGPVVIETHTRFGGDQIWEMTELVTGTRMAGATVGAMLGAEGAAIVAPRAGAAAIRYFAHEDAVISGVHGVAAARAMPGVVRVELRNASPGQVLGPLTGSRARQGYVLAVGDDTTEAIARAEAAHARVVFELTRSDMAPHTVPVLATV